MGLQFVSLSLIMLAADGLMQEHINAHGADSLLPKSKKTFDTWGIIAMLNLPKGTRIKTAAGVIKVGNNLAWQGVRV